MKKYLVELPYTENYVVARYDQHNIFLQQDIPVSFYWADSQTICWLVECEEEQLTLLILKGAQAVTPYYGKTKKIYN